MYRKIFFLLFLCGTIAAAITINAGVVPLKPGTSVTVTHQNGRVNAKGKPTTAIANATAQTTYALDATGTMLSITVKNTAPANSGIVLYALDPFLPVKLVYQTRLEATFSGFPNNSNWVGPTDKGDRLSPTGYCTFATKEAVLGNISDYLNTQTPLPAGFLLPGQSGTIKLKLELDDKAKGAPLPIAPVAYFLAPDPTTPQQKRVPVAAIGN